MRRAPVVVLLLFLFPPLVVLGDPPQETTEYIPFVEIDGGEFSSWQSGRDDFAGAELHITDNRTWETFWSAHTRHISPSPPVPEVAFPREDVIVVLLGRQTSGGGPSIGVQNIVQRGRRNTVITILEDRTPGPLIEITSPYQIIVTPKLGRSIRFEHWDRGERICQAHEDCPPDYLCSRGDRTCASPVTGVCELAVGVACPFVYVPVCGCDGTTYSNPCFLFLDGAIAAYVGECE